MQTLTGEEPDLELGASGYWVSTLQSRLYGLGFFHDSPDGTYNDATESAVRQLQSTLGLDNDGEMHLPTWEALLHLEQQYGLEYNHYAGPGNQVWDDPAYGQRPGGGWPEGYADPNAASSTSGEISPDGQWRWDGYEWQPNEGQSGAAGQQDYAAQGSADEQISPDGQWRWDGYEWQPHDGAGSPTGGRDDDQGGVGQLSPDGYWRWDGDAWQVA